MLADAVGLTLAFAVSIVVFRTTVGPEDPIQHSREIPLFLATLPGWILLAPTRAAFRGLLSEQAANPQPATLAAARGIRCVEVDLAALRGEREPELTLFAI